MSRMIFENNVFLHLSDNWDISDVRSCIDFNDREDAKNFTDDDCIQVLQLVADYFDANRGINWEVIANAIDMVVEDKKQ